MLGWIGVIKPTGYSSFDAVAKVRGMLREYSGDKKIKVGHLGTLDPGGSGVLPIVFGKATRLFDYYASADKVYRARFDFGVTTDTLDSYGKVTDRKDKIPSLEEINSVIPRFLGDIEQVPPIYSRVSVDGVRGYAAARMGKNIKMPSRRVRVHSIDIADYTDGKLTVDISCGGGTYVRSLCRDIATALGTVAYMSYIIRLEAKGIRIEECHTLEEVKENLNGVIRSVEDMIALPRAELSFDEFRRINNGIDIPPRGMDGDYALYYDNKIFAICKDGEKTDCLIRLWYDD